MVSGGAPGRPYGRLTVDEQGLEHDALRAPAAGATARTLVSSGRADAFDVRIVDPVDGRELPAGPRR